MWVAAIPLSGMTGILYEYTRLASSTLTQSCQDKYGFIWVATNFGLSRFDGYHFTNYYHSSKDENSISSNLITKLVCTSDGTLFIGSSRGLMRYDYTTDNFYRFQFPDSIQPRVSTITELTDGKLLVSTSGHGVFAIDKGSRTLRHVKAIEERLNDRYLSFRYTERDGTTWVSTNSGRVFRCKFRGEVPESIADIPTDGLVPIYITETEGGRLLLFFSSKILCFDPVNGQLTDSYISLPKDFGISSVLKAPDNTIYLGITNKGLYVVPSGESTVRKEPIYDSHYLLPDLTIDGLFLDRANDLWMTSSYHGLCFCSTARQKFSSWRFSYKGEKLNAAISSVVPLADGGALCLMKNVGIFRVNKDGNTTKYEENPQGSVSLYHSQDGRYYLGTWRSLYLFNPQNGTFSLLNTMNGKGATNIEEDLQGHLYVSTMGDGFFILDRDGKQLRHYNTQKLPRKRGAKFGNNWISKILCDHQGLMWIATTSGVWCYDPEEDYFVDLNKGDGIMRETHISAICEMNSHDMVLGTQSGLYVYHRADNTVAELPECGALQDMVISSLERDNEGNLWISTPKGIWQYICQNQRLISYVGRSGIVEEEFAEGASYHAADDQMCFGSNGNVTTFYPQELKENDDTMTEQIHITSASTLSQTYNPLGKEFTMPWYDTHFTLEFSLFNYENANITFEYRINTGKWAMFESGDNQLSFTKLKPGKYRIEVRAMSGESCISDTTTIILRVKSPWYASTTAFILYTLAALLALGAIAYYFYRRQKANFEEEKMNLLINATHDIRSPLTLILGPIEKLKDLVKKNSDEETRQVLDQYVDVIDRNADRLLLLVNQILDMRRIDKQQLKLQCRETDIVELVRQVCHSFEFVAEQKSIDLSIEADNDACKVWIDRGNFDKVLTNILSNAFKYTLDGGEVTVRIHSDNTSLTIEVIDSGIGLANEKASRLFERFYQGKQQREGVVGTGIGLNLAMSIVRLHGGTISACNRTDGIRGTCVSIRLPLGHSHLSPENISTETEQMPANQKTIYKRGRIMIVDDDCELSAYVVRELKPWYNIDSFSNGMDALQALLSQPYELVVSDVMMSGMDGITLLKKIKQNPNTSHIPVLLLTSKSEIADRLAGFKSGADAYLVKPFNIDELHARIDNLIDSMRRLRGKYTGAQQQADKVEKVEVDGNDERLMNSIMKSINAHLGDADFNVNALASEIGLSRVQLHRKMKELTGISTGQFIRNIRMEQAKQLILESKLNIAQVAYNVGFNDQTYFSTVFKQYFGKSPSDYAKQSES